MRGASPLHPQVPWEQGSHTWHCCLARLGQKALLRDRRTGHGPGAAPHRLPSFRAQRFIRAALYPGEGQRQGSWCVGGGACAGIIPQPATDQLTGKPPAPTLPAPLQLPAAPPRHQTGKLFLLSCLSTFCYRSRAVTLCSAVWVDEGQPSRPGVHCLFFPGRGVGSESEPWGPGLPQGSVRLPPYSGPGTPPAVRSRVKLKGPPDCRGRQHQAAQCSTNTSGAGAGEPSALYSAPLPLPSRSASYKCLLPLRLFVQRLSCRSRAKQTREKSSCSGGSHGGGPGDMPDSFLLPLGSLSRPSRQPPGAPEGLPVLGRAE